MNHSKIRLKRKAFKKLVQAEEGNNKYIQPFKELPSLNSTGKASADRINAHDLFSHYTADIIKEDTIYFR